MRTITTTVYSFNELSTEAQQTAISNFRDDQYEAGDVLYMFADNCNEFLKEKGFVNPQVKYSLTGSQGDGLCFKADDYSFLNELVLDAIGTHHPHLAGFLTSALIVRITGNTGYYCFASKSDVELELDWYNNPGPNVEAILNKVEESLQKVYISLCKELEKDGYNDIELETSDEGIKETILLNNYEFTENGEMI